MSELERLLEVGKRGEWKADALVCIRSVDDPDFYFGLYEGKQIAALHNAAPDFLRLWREGDATLDLLCEACVRLNPQHREGYISGECRCGDTDAMRSTLQSLRPLCRGDTE